MPGLDVRIEAAPTKSGCSVKASGTILHPITKKEIESFGLTQPNMKSSVGKVHGKEPDRVALNDSYDCGYLYKDYDWKPIQTVLTVKNAEILEVTSEPTIISTQPLINKSKTKTGTFNANISQQVEHTTETNWSQTDSVEFSQSISYSVKFLGSGVEGSTSMSYSHEVGKGGSESKAITVSASQGLEVELDPGESVNCQLTASRGVLKVRITYTAEVIGDVAVDYMKGYRDHHYYRFDVGYLREETGNFQPQEVTEDIEVGFFANAMVQMEDYDDPNNPKKSDETDEADKSGRKNKDKNDDDSKKKKKTDGNNKNNAKESKEKGEKKEAKKADNTTKLRCNGQPCEKCKKCRDWQYHGKKETWDWIRNFLTWKDADWDRWCDKSISKGFVRKDGASCSDAPDSGASDGSARYLSYIFLIHICLCDENPGTNEVSTDTDEENASANEENQETDEASTDADEENASTNEANQKTDENNADANEENQQTDEENAGTNQEEQETDANDQETNEENQENKKENPEENPCKVQ